MKLLSFLFVPAIVSFVLTACGPAHRTYQPSGAGDSYEEKVLSVAEIEQADPVRFLSADGTYNQNFLGNKLKIHGMIQNRATVATYKDAVVRITFYSKTKTVLGTEDYTVYEFFPPASTKSFELKVDNYRNVASIGWDVISAVAP